MNINPFFAFDWAVKELGIHETPGPKSTPRILEYRKIAGCAMSDDDGDLPWCKIFVNAACVSTGQPILKNWMARSIESDPNFVKMKGPALGCIISFWRGSRWGGQGHTGFYCGETASRVYTLGGNESDSVRKAFFAKNSKSFGVAGYYWPKKLPLPAVAPVVLKDDGSPSARAA